MADRKNQFSTADLMKAFNIGRNALRLYEDMGLLQGMTRTEAGYRIYNVSHMESLKFILNAKESGFMLNEIKSLLEVASTENKMTCGAMSAEISSKINDIEKEVATLNLKKKFLSQFFETCKSKEITSHCDVVTAGFSKEACC